jgi:hypothetical protein
MPEKISWTLNVQVVGGPKLLASQTITVDAYDMLQVSILDAAADKEVQVQPGASGVQFLLISSDQYGDKLTYKVNDGSSSTSAIKLDAPHVLIGSGAVGLLDKAPIKLLFSNTMGKAASVQILVGRDATP